MEFIQFELSTRKNPSWNAQKVKMHLPSILSTIPIITHRDRSTIEQDSDNEIISDRWEVNVLEPLPNWISRRLHFQLIEVDSTLYWDERSRTVEWFVTLPDHPDLLPICEGTLQFEDAGSGTLIRIEGHFDLNFSEIPGVPGFFRMFLSGSLGTLAERIIGRYLPDIKEELERIDLDHAV